MTKATPRAISPNVVVRLIRTNIQVSIGNAFVLNPKRVGGDKPPVGRSEARCAGPRDLRQSVQQVEELGAVRSVRSGVCARAQRERTGSRSRSRSRIAADSNRNRIVFR